MSLDKMTNDAFHALPDNELIDQLMQGNSQVYGVLCTRYTPKVRGVIAPYAKYRNDVIDEIAQEIFLKAYQNLNNYCKKRNLHEGGNFNAWLIRIARNTAINYVRDETGRYRLLGKNRNSLESWGTETSAPDSVYKAELKKILQPVLASLSPERKAVIRLRYYEDLSYKEIADALDIPPGTVMSRLSRARQSILEAHPTLAEYLK